MKSEDLTTGFYIYNEDEILVYDDTMPMTHCEAVGIMGIWNEELCAECMWQHKSCWWV